MSSTAGSGSGAVNPVATQATSIANQTFMQSLIYSQSIYAINKIKESATSAIKEIKGSTATSASDSATSLLADYNTLLADINAYLPTAAIPSQTQLNTDIVNFRARDSALQSRFNALAFSGGFFATAGQAINFYIYFFLQVFGPIMAIIIVTNMSQGRIYQIFFSFWGALWYPLVLAIGIINPPVWRVFTFKAPIEGNWESGEASKLYIRIISGILFTLFIYAFYIYNAT